MWELLQFTLDNICVLGCCQQLGSANQRMRPAETRELVAVKVASQRKLLLLEMIDVFNLSELGVAWGVPQSFRNCKQRNFSCPQLIEELVCDLFHGVLKGMYPR